MIQEMHERLKKANERRNCGADDEITRLRAALAAKDAEVERLRKANGLLEGLNVPLHAGPDGCPHYYDGCHCLSVENDRLIKEVERLRTDVELLLWNLAGCSTIATMERPTDFNKEMARPALHDVNDLAKKYQDSRAEIERLRTALRVVLAARPSLTEKGWQIVQDALGEGGKKEAEKPGEEK